MQKKYLFVYKGVVPNFKYIYKCERRGPLLPGVGREAIRAP
jgi:hypothetical protein